MIDKEKIIEILTEYSNIDSEKSIFQIISSIKKGDFDVKEEKKIIKDGAERMPKEHREKLLKEHTENNVQIQLKCLREYIEIVQERTSYNSKEIIELKKEIEDLKVRHKTQDMMISSLRKNQIGY